MLSLELIIEKLARYHPQELTLTVNTAAVMLVLLRTDTNDSEIVITERAHSLGSYAGHYSFPGGTHDEADKDLWMTAQREFDEELGIPFGAYQKLGQLNDFPDRYGNLVRPFVVLMDKKKYLEFQKISTEEIHSVFFLPISQLDAFRDNPDLYSITRRRPSYSYTLGEVFIWGLTAGILVHFLRVVE